MLQGINDYVRCALRNRFVIGSYTGIGSCIGLLLWGYKTEMQIPVVIYAIDGLVMFVSLFILKTTDWGLETMRAYRRMKKHISTYGTIDSRFKERFSSTYCTQVGMKIAAEEAGLENLI